MSLNPSNLIAARDNPNKTMFPNLARRTPADEATHKELDEECTRELELAGIKTEGYEIFRSSGGEVPTKIVGELGMWSFTRAWYYWVAKGPGIPPNYAMKLHEIYGTQVRVEGHCGCPSPLEYNKGFAIGMYHIDTQEGLIALANTIRKIMDDAKCLQDM